MGIKYSRHVRPCDVDELKEKVRKIEAERKSEWLLSTRRKRQKKCKRG